MEKRFPRVMGSLHGIHRFVSDFFSAHGIDESSLFDVDLIIEEIFTNQVKYADGTQDILVEIDKKGSALVVSVTDFDVERFDITKAGKVDVDRPLHERQPGGLGIHFIRDMADTVEYEYRDRCSKVTITKRVERR
jgi:anti-sigma regulatory factor (Ser/Thr protein kinase)